MNAAGAVLRHIDEMLPGEIESSIFSSRDPTVLCDGDVKREEAQIAFQNSEGRNRRKRRREGVKKLEELKSFLASFFSCHLYSCSLSELYRQKWCIMFVGLGRKSEV